MGSVGAILSFLKAARGSLGDPSARLLPVVLFGVLKDDISARSIDGIPGLGRLMREEGLKKLSGQNGSDSGDSCAQVPGRD